MGWEINELVRCFWDFAFWVVTGRRSGTIYGTNLSYHDSTRMGRKPSRKGTIYGTLTLERNPKVDGSSGRFIANWRGNPLQWLMQACAGNGLLVSGTRKRREVIYPCNLAHQDCHRGWRGTTRGRCRVSHHKTRRAVM